MTRNDLLLVDELGLAPLDNTGAQLLFRFIAAVYERRSLGSPPTGRANPGDGFCPSTPPRSRCSTGGCTTATPSPPTAIPTGRNRPERTEEPASRPPEINEGWGPLIGHQRGPRTGR